MDLPSTGGGNDLPLDVPEIDPTDAGATCFLNVLCITATAQAGDVEGAGEINGMAQA